MVACFGFYTKVITWLIGYDGIVSKNLVSYHFNSNMAGKSHTLYSLFILLL